MSADAAPFRILDPVWVTLPDGVRLAARVWLPASAAGAPVPAILDCGPHRRRDGSYLRDHRLHAWHALQGYAGVRLDIRGSGDSDGLLEDQLGRDELPDMLAAIEFLARQPWCNGRVGVLGDAWSGATALRLAARRPAALGAIVTVGAAPDRYLDAGLYRGGALTTGGLVWGGALMAMQSRPPDPRIVGDRWQRMWLARLEALPLFVGTWLSHQVRDRYWLEAAWQPAREAITCPVLAIADGGEPAADAALRVLADHRGPAAAVIGPPAPATMDPLAAAPHPLYLAEAMTWWDRWLKDGPATAGTTPALRMWCRSSDPGHGGEWLAVGTWPAATRSARRHLAPGILADAPGEPGALTVLRSDGHGGVATRGVTEAVFEDAPLAAPITILGAATLRLVLAADAPDATIHATLLDVAATGEEVVIAEGLQNLVLRAGYDVPTPLPPGRLVPATITFGAAAHHLRRGCRLRLRIATTAWPAVMPPPQPVVLSLHLHDAVLDVPLAADAQTAAAAGATLEAPAAPRHEVRRVPASEERSGANGGGRGKGYELRSDSGLVFLPETGLASEVVGVASLGRATGGGATLSGDWRHRLAGKGLAVSTRTRLQLSASAYRFDIAAALDARMGDKPIVQREWRVGITRRYV
ncbi:MAG: CocE/NonD family hydrolase [Alphaproteobacteria bacterium]|nr:CocE/NonD family hydrolase [Alphaproteobacteria bacterium]